MLKKVMKALKISDYNPWFWEHPLRYLSPGQQVMLDQFIRSREKKKSYNLYDKKSPPVMIKTMNVETLLFILFFLF